MSLSCYSATTAHLSTCLSIIQPFSMKSIRVTESGAWTDWALYFCAFIVSMGMNFTRVPWVVPFKAINTNVLTYRSESIIYAFREMTCDEYYEHHPPHVIEGDRCSVAVIEAATARAVSILGATITINGSSKSFRSKRVSNGVRGGQYYVCQWVYAKIPD